MEKYIVPQVDLVEDNNNYIIFMDMPGVKKENIEINLENNELTIIGKFEKVDENWKYLFGNRNFYDYKRSYQINSKIDQDNIQADYENGVLKLTLPKSAEAKPKRIEIK